MAVTKTSFEWTASSSLTQTVPFEVIAAGDIDVYVEGVLQLQQNTTSTADATHPQVVSGEITQGTALTNYTVASNNGSITFNANLTVDDFVVIERTTDDTLLETFTSGSTVRARDLNSAFERVLFIAQEGVNIANEALAPSDDEDDALDAKGERISNVADATDDDDAVNRAQLGKVITDDLVAGEGIDLTDVTGGTNSGKQVTVSAELSTAVNPGVVRVNATTPITATYTNPGQLDLSIENNSIDIGKIQTDDIITLAEQNAGSPNPADTKLFTSSAAAKRFDTLVQTNTPPGSDYQVGKTWLQNDDELTLSIWNGNAWTGIASGGTFTNQPKVVYVDASSGDDNNDGHRISRPKLTIKAAVNQINNDDDFGDGSVVIVAPGVYQEALPIQIERKNVSIIGNALRSCIVHPTVATQESTMFELNSGSYIANLTLTGMKASGSLGNSVDAVLPTSQGWNFAFFNNAVITKSPYIQNCTNFSDSEIDNSNLNANTPAGGLAGDTDSAPTGGGLLVDGSVPSTSSPLRSIVCDSYTHVGLNGPGILVTNNGYVQATSSYAFFNRYHIKCLNGGQANLAASTTDFGDQALVADGKSTTAIFTANTTANAAQNDITFTVGAQTAGSGWFGDTTRPGTNMLVELGGTVYPILSAVANGSGWDVTISRPDPNNRSSNLGLVAAVNSGSTAEFFLRSMIASSGHTMEYVGSGTDYRALPENGGVPDETKQITELNDGKVWTAITDHNGKFKIGGNQTDDPIFEIDQQLGFVTIPEGSIAFNLLSDLTPQLGGDLDLNGQGITSSVTNGNISINPNGTGVVTVNSSLISGVSDPVSQQDAATKNYVDNEVAAVDKIIEGNTEAEVVDTGSDGHFKVTTEGTERLRVDSSGRVGIGTTSPSTSLDVSGAISLGSVAIPSAGTARIYSRNTDNNLYLQTGSGDTINFLDGSQNTLASFGDTALVFNTGNSERMRVDSSGNVGIGTTSASNDIHLKRTGSDAIIRIENTGNGNASGIFFVRENSSGTSKGAANIHVVSDTSRTGTEMVFGCGSNTSATGGERMRIDSNGRLMVGSTGNSGAKLFVAGGSGQSAGTEVDIARFFASTASSTNSGGLTIGGVWHNTDVNQRIAYLQSEQGNNPGGTARRLSLNPDGGNVGIGTKSPSVLLHVKESTGAHANLILENSEGSAKLGTNSNVFYVESSQHIFYNSGGTTEYARIDSSGRLLSGLTSAPGTVGGFSHVNIGGTSVNSNGAIGLYRNTASPSAGQGIGAISFANSEGNRGALIQALSGGTWGTNDYPGELAFSTTADGASSVSERVRIKSNGNVGVGTNNAQAKLEIGGIPNSGATNECFTIDRFDGTQLYSINYNQTTNTVEFHGNNKSFAFQNKSSNGESMRIDSSGRLLINTGTDGEITTQSGANLQIRATSEAPQIILGRNDTTATPGETLGMLKWMGNDGGSYQECAAVTAVVDAAHANNDKPTRLSFYISKDNTATLTEHLRVDSSGRTSIANVGSFYSAGEALSVSTSNNGSVQVMRNTNASFNNSMLFAYSSRSANQAFQFVKFASAAASDAEFILRGDGNGYADGSWIGGGADYAEYFEWSDGNTEAEDRRGISVVLDGDKIREAVAGEEPIGVISGNPSVVGDSDIDRWKGKYLRDDFGTYLQDTHNVVEWDETITNEDGSERIKKHSYEDWNIPDGIVVPDYAVVSATDENGQPYTHRRLNPDYNPDTEYVSREDRPEWDTVGLMGKLRIRKGQVTGTRWIKMRDVSDTVEEWLVR